ncbi:hypothetical protein EV356DRAFT_387187 [Viridothelium virens]|uniref:Uncharacterized protein n=1 Tax=Viridothelium virens TaxID=1048519 RepID=A0A6A6GUY8_VIRVR|nr:hypothetical protein EV356DRAFT_387187 [Viridothelium virens]
MAATKRRQRVQPKGDELELAVLRILKASPIQKAEHRRALTFLRFRIQREEAELAPYPILTSSSQISAIENENTVQLAQSTGRMDRQPEILISGEMIEQPQAGEYEPIINLCLKLAKQETEIVKFFQDGGHLLCLEPVATNEDRRLQHVMEHDGGGLTEQHTQFRRLLALLSLAADYEIWEVALLDKRPLTETTVTTFIREHPESFPDQDAARRAIYTGNRYRDLDREFPGISAIMAFVPREFSRACPLEWLNKQLHLEELKFIPELGKRFLPHLDEAQQAYKQRLGMDVTERQANVVGASLYAMARGGTVNGAQTESPAAQIAAHQGLVTYSSRKRVVATALIQSAKA